MGRSNTNLTIANMSEKREYILCSAIHYDDGKQNRKRRSFSYPETGILICGYRHADIISILPTNNSMRNDGIEYKCTQGFLTSKGRFVNREEAYKIAFREDQLLEGVDFTGKTMLYSEDIY